MRRKAVGGITVMMAVGGSAVIPGRTEGEATVVVTDWAKRNGLT
jgi:hypothetical protein